MLHKFSKCDMHSKRMKMTVFQLCKPRPPLLFFFTNMNN